MAVLIVAMQTENHTHSSNRWILNTKMYDNNTKEITYMTFLQLANKRYSARKYKDQTIEKEKSQSSFRSRKNRTNSQK